VEKRAKIFPPDEVFLRLMIERNPRALDRVSLVLELPGKMPATKKPVSGCGTAKRTRGRW
jgi:hypothetical protein